MLQEIYRTFRVIVTGLVRTFDVETTMERFLSVVLRGLAVRPEPPPETGRGSTP